MSTEFSQEVELMVVQMWFTGALVGIPAFVILAKIAWDEWKEKHPGFEFHPNKNYVKVAPTTQTRGPLR